MDQGQTLRDTQPSQPRAGLWQRLLRALWLPGVELMASLRMPGKLAVLVTVLAAPMCLFMVKDFIKVVEDQRQMRAAVESIEIVRALIDTNASLCRMTTLSLAQAAGDAAFAPLLADERTKASQAMDKVVAAVQSSRELGNLHLWHGVRGQLDKLVNRNGSASMLAGEEEFEAASRALHEMVHQVAQQGHLGELTEHTGQLLTTMLVDDVQHLAQTACELTTAGSTLLAAKANAVKIDSELDRGKILGLARTVMRDISTAKISLTQLARGGTDAPGSWDQAVELAEYLVTDSNRRFKSTAPVGSAAGFYDTASVVVDQLVSVQHDISNRLLVLANRRGQELVRAAYLTGAVWLAGLLLTAYIVTVYLFSIHGALRQLIKGMQATAAGDLSHRVKVRGNDELAQLAQSFDQMNERLSDNTSDIRSRAARVDQSGRQVAEGSQQLAMRTDQQAQSVGNAVRAFAKVAAAVSHNAQATRELDALTERLFTQAEDGNVAMAETVMAMDDLESAATRVSEMVVVIDDVAFHTGMLALNASVEAARAGPAGKGFAVVAGEIRQLALRCAESADEIRELTHASAIKVRDSSNKLQHVSVAIDQLVNGVREVSVQLRSIATASTQQSASLQEIETNIGSLEAITRDNATLVEESNSASQTLVSQGESLSATVGGMRLRHGSADEARNLVERALAHATEHGRDRALREFSHDAPNWTDRDLFIFCLDRSGIILANAMTPQRVGTNVDTLDGLRGARHSERLWDCLRSHGNGWVRYSIVHPQTGTLRTKETYVCALDDATLMGCGCYTKAPQETTAGTASPSPVAWSRKSEGMAVAA